MFEGIQGYDCKFYSAVLRAGWHSGNTLTHITEGSSRISGAIQTILIEGIRSFTQSMQTNCGIALRIGNECYFSDRSQFIVIQQASYHSTLCSLDADSAVNKNA
jgi:hypothetical protein